MSAIGNANASTSNQQQKSSKTENTTKINDGSSQSTNQTNATTALSGIPGNSIGVDYSKHITGKGTSEDPFIFDDPRSGNTFVWDAQLQNWKQVSEQYLMAQQRSVYGAAVPEKKVEEKKDDSKKRKKEQQPTAFKTGNVYVTGLPPDLTQKEFVEFFSRAGVLKKDPETAAPKAKIYLGDDGIPKGDGLVCYYRSEAVDLAIMRYDDTEIRPGVRIKVQRAVFDPKAEKGKKKGKKTKKKGIKIYDQEKELTWDENEVSHVIIKNVFSQEEAWTSRTFFKELEEELLQEVRKIGEVEKIKIFERNPEGVVVVKFKDPLDAEACVRRMNERWFGGKQLISEIYDGWTNYQVDETDEQRDQRLRSFGEWLSTEENNNSAETP